MSQKIELTYKGVDYTLEFTRRTVDLLQRRGFVISDIGDKPNILVPMLFAGAFLANHKKVKPAVVDEIYSKLPNKEDLLTQLITMYNETASDLCAEPEEDEEGNASWKVI